jgi:predicted TIM-barrel fold metal-dependent hydrolase
MIDPAGLVPPPPLLPAAVAAVALAACVARCVMDWISGASSRAPSRMESDLSPAARALLARAYDGVDASKLVDYHVHVFGLGEGGSGCYVNPRMRSWAHPVDRLKFLAYRSAARIEDEERAESGYLARIVDLARGHRGRFVLLAFDEHRGADGVVVPEKTEFFVPNDHAIACAAQHPDLFVPAASVHPLRPGALDELSRCAARGARIVKWLPNAMGIDPSDPRHGPFYDRARELGLAILSHGGEEQAVRADEDQRLGNPLLLRAALDRGVKVIVAHCAGLGDDEDLDAPGRPRVASWKLLLRMMEDPRWEGLLFADVSAMTQVNRTPEPLRTFVARTDLHPRMVNGSDYPLPAVNVLVQTRKLARTGMITHDERAALNEVYDFNPLVFDFALKRTLRVRDRSGREVGFAPSVFEEHPALPVA